MQRVWIPCLVALFLGTGCASNKSPEVAQSQQQLQAAERQIDELERQIKERDQAIAERDRAIAERDERLQHQPAATAAATPPVSAPPPALGLDAGTELLPPAAQAGQCFARVFIPPTYGTETETVLKRAEATQIETIPARFETAEERVLLREASKKLEVVPAEYDWVEEQVEVRAASTRLEAVPAEYEWVEEQVLVKPAHQVWKEGRGPIERVDHATGEIMCLVEVPAQYKTVRKRVVKTPATTRTVEIPAEYQTIKKRVLVKPPTTREIEIPAEYKMVAVRRLVEPAKEVVKEIPAEYDTVTKQVKTSEGEMAWREILCETNMSSDLVLRLQRALDQAGYSPGPLDGVYGSGTLSAVTAYQGDKGLPRGHLTLATLESLGVQP